MRLFSYALWTCFSHEYNFCFSGTLHQSAQHSCGVGIVENLGMLQVAVPMKAFVMHVAGLDTVPRIALIPELLPADLRLCNNCYKLGHMAADCTNDKACKNCRKTGHIARDCQNEPVCNLCNVSGHMARQCSKGNSLAQRGGSGRNSSYRDVICRSCNQVGHMSRDCVGPMIICYNCGGRGHRAVGCPSGRIADRGFRRY